MLCVLDDALELDAVVRNPSFNPAHSVLCIPAAERASLAACRSLGRDESLSLDRWLQEFYRTGVLKRGLAASLNQVLLVWRRPDDRLRAVLVGLQGLAETRIDIAIILAGPLEADGVGLLGLFDTCAKTPSLVLSSIWYLGNGSDDVPVFEATDRKDVVRRMVKVLFSEDAQLAESLGLFRGNDILLARQNNFAQVNQEEADPSSSATGTPTQGIFSAFGLKSWEPWVEEIDSVFVRRLAGAVMLAEQQDRDASLPEVRKRMADAAATLLSTLASLGTPYDATVQGNSTQSLPEQLPPPPEFIYDIVERFPARELLQPALEQAIRAHELALLDYRAGLKDALSGMSQKIRRNGRRIFVQGLKEAREFIEHTSGLLETSALLKEFFPRLPAARSVVPLTPCDPASEPHEIVCRRYGAKAQATLASACSALPSAVSIRRLQMVSCALACISPLMLAHRPLWIWAWIPALVGALLVSALSWHCRGVAAQIVATLAQEFQVNGTELRSHFVEKLRWVLQKAQRAVENQLVGEISSIGRKLQMNHSHFYAGGIAAAVQKMTTALIIKMMTVRRVPEAVAQNCRQKMEKAASRLIADAVKEGAPSVGRVVAQELLDQIADELNTSVVLPRPTMATIQEEFQSAAGRKDQPPIPARLPPGADSSFFARHYLLPREYHDKVSWSSQLPRTGGHGISTQVLQAPSLHEPLMISRRVALDISDVKRSLAQSGASI